MTPVMPPSPEECTAGALYHLAELLALSDEAGSTSLAIDTARHADVVARLEIQQRTTEYREMKERIDRSLAGAIGRIDEITRARELVHTSSGIIRLVDDLLLLTSDVLI